MKAPVATSPPITASPAGSPHRISASLAISATFARTSSRWARLTDFPVDHCRTRTSSGSVSSGIIATYFATSLLPSLDLSGCPGAAWSCLLCDLRRTSSWRDAMSPNDPKRKKMTSDELPPRCHDHRQQRCQGQENNQSAINLGSGCQADDRRHHAGDDGGQTEG
jgi:hypothetical protein